MEKKGNIINESEKTNNEEVKLTDKVEKKKKERYISFNARITFSLILTIVMIITSVMFINLSIDRNKNVYVNYQESSSTGYKVYLKPNDFYEAPYLDENMTYIASLIDYINVSFKYNFMVNRTSTINHDYKIVASLVITPEGDSGKILYTKDYVLEDNVKGVENSASGYSLDKTIAIDYNKYNDLANTFKSTYGVSCDSKLIIKLITNTLGKESEFGIDYNNSSSSTLTIPLSTRQININIDASNTNKNGSATKTVSAMIGNKPFFVAGIILILLGLASFIYLIKLLVVLLPKKDKYNSYVNKLLNDYDRTIVETNRIPDLKEHDVYKITKFQELLDVRDNLKIPIMYVKINSEKCCFYVKDGKVLYIYYVKSVDL